METYVVRLWVSDRPGALGAVASSIGAAGGDVVGIEILERGAGRAIDELVVELPGPEHVDRLVAEISAVEGVDVEFVAPVAGAVHDPRLDALETAAILVGAATPDELLEALVAHSARTIGAAWAAVVDLEEGEVWAATPTAPDGSWLSAFVEGTRMLSVLDGGGPSDVAWAPMPASGVALVLGRDGTAFRALERRHVAALARIADTRFRDLTRRRSRGLHPSMTSTHGLS
ncbi:MAG TPA: ACT domain-containing protein [Acidimicrobiales bacterium]|nr:ACT domain-containing protein [Acidimicrobiales bacterium]